MGRDWFVLGLSNFIPRFVPAIIRIVSLLNRRECKPALTKVLKLTDFFVMLSRKAKHLAGVAEKQSLRSPDSSLHFVSLRMTNRYKSLNTKELRSLPIIKRSV
jgi:hypothetical protein